MALSIINNFILPRGESLFFSSPKKSNQKKGGPSRPDFCALQKIAVVPVRYACRIVTQTYILYVCQQFFCSDRELAWD
ncbi:MAG: hypothetical protein EOO52_06920 [Gammaproteobacteria bacterium]|nr:MAG: hypothetical protein EOO52_06920 [Gammaproteobacteria bacterium]